MSAGRFVLRGGTVVAAGGVVEGGDVLVEDGTIALVGAGVAEDGAAAGAEVVDARGKLVLPGAVDPHTHLDTVFRGQRTADDFVSGTAAALAGGTTTVVDFALQQRGVGVLETLSAWRERLEAQRPLANVAVHFAVTDLAAPGAEAELALLPREGVTSLKTYMAYPGRTMLEDDDQYRVMRAAARSGQTVLVHAENGRVIDRLVREALEAGQLAPRFHARTRPPELEAEAVARAIRLAGFAGCGLYVVHVSSALAVAPVAAARAAGARVAGETCPQYLVLDEALLDGPDEEAAKYVFTPPPRRAADRERLLRALAAGELSSVGSDHCPFNVGDQKRMGPAFTEILNGVPGVEQRLTLLHDRGVRSGALSLERWVELCCTAPARLMGLPRKGALTPGADADLVLFDPLREQTISAATQRSAVDYTPYEGLRVTGAVERVWLRGRLAVDGGEVVARQGSGGYVGCEPGELT